MGASVDVITHKLEQILENAPRTTNTPYGATPMTQVFITPRLKRVMDVANEEAKKLKDDYISTEHLFLGIASERNTPSANILREEGVSKERLHEAIQELRNGARVTEPNSESKYRVLEKYSRDLTQCRPRGQA